jgi:hypothetical protein
MTGKTKPVPQSFTDVLNSWGNMAFLAAEMGQQDGTVRKWRQRNYIPPEYWQTLLKVAKRHRIRHITADRLIRIAATRLNA